MFNHFTCQAEFLGPRGVGTVLGACLLSAEPTRYQFTVKMRLINYFTVFYGLTILYTGTCQV